jgi:hypothetical protein
LHNFFKNQFGQRLLPDPSGSGGHPKNSNYYTIWPFGLFDYLFTPFGLSNAAQMFQRMMDLMVDNLEAVFAYMDNCRVGSPAGKHTPHSLGNIFFCPGRQWPCNQLEKCVFAVPTLEILGQTISAPTAEQTTAIDSCPGPQDIKHCKDSSAW